MACWASTDRRLFSRQSGEGPVGGKIFIADQEGMMMNGYGMGLSMGFGWLGMIGILVLAGLAIAALVKYLRK